MKFFGQKIGFSPEYRYGFDRISLLRPLVGLKNKYFIENINQMLAKIFFAKSVETYPKN